MKPAGLIHSTDWLTAVRRYLLASAGGHLIWETVQLPLYTIWRFGSARDIVLAILHCTLGDVLIATAALVAALAGAGTSGWPYRGFRQVLAATMIIGAGYTAYSEYVNTVVRQNWSYTPSMPVLPWLGTGIAPFAQWLVIPLLALIWSRQDSKRSSHGNDYGRQDSA